MNNIVAIHQFTPTVAYGDGVSDGLLYTQRLLREFGFSSNIYISSNFAEINFKHEVFHIDQYKESPKNYLLYHHSISHGHHHTIMKFQDKKILVYHNITPSHFFKNNLFLQQICDEGRVQLKDAKNYMISSYTDSHYNKKELDYFGFDSPEVLPILIDFTKKKKVTPNQEILKRYSGTFNILFVGRIVQNKCQHQLIDTAYFLKQQGLNFKLFIVGGASQVDYLEYLHRYIDNLSLNEQVIITGKVDDSDLAAYYKNSDLYLSLSEHEGFGIPLIEAMRYDTPVLAFNTCAIETTISKNGLLHKKSALYVSKKIFELISSPIKRIEIVKEQKKILNTYDPNIIKTRFKDFLQSLNIHIPNDLPLDIPENKQTNNIQIEGPFDSSYSLAIVNKDIAKALSQEEQNNVKLHSTEGYGDFKPDLSKCEEDIKNLALKHLDAVDITIRNLYPPRTNAMQGYHKIIGPYGWEESKFPKEYVELFNSRLTTLLTMSNYVSKVMKTSGIYTPTFSTGLVADNLLKIKSKPFSFELPDAFKLLHISSAFPRKGLDILLESFDELIQSTNIEISLIIKTFPNPHNRVLEDLQRLDFKVDTYLEENITLYAKNGYQILLINKDIDQSYIKYLYENSDLLVAPSLGEGFGLPMAEAMLHELPVLTTAYGGQSDFCNEETSWHIDFDFAFAQTHFSIPNSIWQLPKGVHLKEQIQKIYHLSSLEKQAKIKRAKEFILANYTQERVAQKINTILSTTQEQKEQKIALFSTYNTRCGIAKYSKYLISSFKDKVTIFANIEKSQNTEEDSANIFRLWQDSRDTKDIEKLKQNILKHKINSLIVQYNFSFISLQALEELLFFCKKHTIQTHIFLHSTKDVQTPHYKDSFSSIAQSLQEATRIYIHTLQDLNYLKDFGIYKNTSLFPHGVDSTIVLEKKQNATTPIIATFGFLLPQKGILELIDIAELLHKRATKVKLLLLNSIHPAPISKELQSQLLEKIQNSPIKEYIRLESDFLDEEVILEHLTNADKIIFPYKNTQESSSAAVRFGILSQNEVITTPLSIFEDVKAITTQSPSSTIEDIANTIEKSLQTKFDNTKQKEWIKENSWSTISKNFYNSIV